MEKLPELKRITAVFTKPKAAMEDIGRYPTILLPIMVMVIVPILSVVVNIGYYRDTMLQMTATQLQGTGVDPGFMVQAQLYGMMVTAPLMTAAGWLLYSLLILILVNIFGGDGEFGYKRALSVTGYAYLVTALFAVVSMILLRIDTAYLLTFSLLDLVKLFAPIENTYVISLLQIISLPRLWEMFVVAVGLCVVRELSMAKAVAIVVILFILQYAVQIGSVAMTSGLLVQAG